MHIPVNEQNLETSQPYSPINISPQDQNASGFPSHWTQYPLSRSGFRSLHREFIRRSQQLMSQHFSLGSITKLSNTERTLYRRAEFMYTYHNQEGAALVAQGKLIERTCNQDTRSWKTREENLLPGLVAKAFNLEIKVS
jgi:hypothetical protein